MYKKYMVIFIFILFGLSYAQPVSADSLEVMLERAINYYNNGEYEYAISELEKALQYLKQLEKTDLVEAYKYLAFSYVAFGDNTKAKEQFKKALTLDPQLELDPTTVSPKIIRVFEEVKAEMPAPPPPPVEEPTEPVIVKREVSTFGATMRSCCVPGLGQMYRGERSKGLKIMIASGITLSASLLSLGMREAAHQDYLDVEPGNIGEMNDKYDKYKFWHNAAVLTSAGFIVTYLYNIFDVIFTKPITTSSLNNVNKGLYCRTHNGHFQFGYNITF